MGHTACGGIRAALEDVELTDIRNYLSPLNKIKEEVKNSGLPKEEQLALLEKEAVRMSCENLLSYDYIKERVDAGELTINGWVMDLASEKLIEVV